MKTPTIGQLAKQAGVGAETIRFYQREGLVAEPERRPSGYLQYTPEVMRRVDSSTLGSVGWLEPCVHAQLQRVN